MRISPVYNLSFGAHEPHGETKTKIDVFSNKPQEYMHKSGYYFSLSNQEITNGIRRGGGGYIKNIQNIIRDAKDVDMFNQVAQAAKEHITRAKRGMLR